MKAILCGVVVSFKILSARPRAVTQGKYKFFVGDDGLNKAFGVFTLAIFASRRSWPSCLIPLTLLTFNITRWCRFVRPNIVYFRQQYGRNTDCFVSAVQDPGWEIKSLNY